MGRRSLILTQQLAEDGPVIDAAHDPLQLTCLLHTGQALPHRIDISQIHIVGRHEDRLRLCDSDALQYTVVDRLIGHSGTSLL